MILHALALAARDVAIGFGLCMLPSLLALGVVVAARKLTARADRRYIAAVEREREANRAQLRMHERHRSEMRAYNARPTSAERWGGRAA